MSRRLPLQLVLAAGALLVIWALLPRRSGSGEADGSPAEIEAYVFANRTPEVNPPLSALQPDVLADPVRRLLARIEWGRPEVFYWSARHLPTDPEERSALARGLLAKFETVVVGSPLLAQRLIDALALLAAPEARDLLIEIAGAPSRPEYLRTAALRALAKYPADAAIADLFAQASVDPHQTVAHTALTEVVKSEILGVPERLNGFLDANDGPDVVPFLQQVATRRLAECAEACVRHLDAALLRERQIAILALLSLHDPRGFAAGAEELAQPDLERVSVGLSLYRDAEVLPPLARARELAASPSGPLRRDVAQALGPAATAAMQSIPGSEGDEESVVAILRKLAADADPVVQQVAVQQLWRHGRQEAVAEWREQLRRGQGAALREAAQFLCETLKDPLAAAIIRERLEATHALPLAGADLANLLNGLRHVGGREDVGRYVERMLAAGSRDDLRGSERTFLSEYASLYVQTFGALAVTPLREGLARATTPRAKLTLIDALRGVVKEADATEAERACDALLALASAEAEERSVRLAALDTIAFFDDPQLGARLLAARESLHDAALADRARVLYAAFF